MAARPLAGDRGRQVVAVTSRSQPSRVRLPWTQRPEPAIVLARSEKAAERAIPEGVAPRLRISFCGPHDRRLAPWRHGDSLKSRPREVLRPGGMVVPRIDCGRNCVRPSLPKLVPQNRRAWLAFRPRPPRPGVSAMPVHNQYPPNPWPASEPTTSERSATNVDSCSVGLPGYAPKPFTPYGNTGSTGTPSG